MSKPILMTQHGAYYPESEIEKLRAELAEAKAEIEQLKFDIQAEGNMVDSYCKERDEARKIADDVINIAFDVCDCDTLNAIRKYLNSDDGHPSWHYGKGTK